jgi:O-antigen/teichoic acid export membrane protein
MDKLLDASLKKVVKGTGIVFIGTLVGIFIKLLARVMVARYVSPAEYGILFLSLSITTCIVILSTLGFPMSLPKLISHSRAENNNRKIWGIIYSAIFITFISSFFLTFFVFLFSKFISDFFGISYLKLTLSVLVFTIPPLAIINILISIFQGFDDAKPKVYFQNLLTPLVRILLISIVIFLGLSFRGILYAYLISSVIVLGVFIIFSFKKLPQIVLQAKPMMMTKKILFFSMPLLGVALSNLVTQHSDTLLLGYFTTSKMVGLYNIARPLANCITLLLGSAAFLYLPSSSFLYSKKAFEEIKKLYVSTTKWIFILTLPLFLLLVFIPQKIIKLLFGTQYIEAGLALQILTVGFFVHIFFGLNGMTLLAFGENKFIMNLSVMNALLNIVLGLLLIPKFGLEGAAFAGAISFLFMNILASARLYRISKIHPFQISYLKSVVSSVTASGLFYLIVRNCVVNDTFLIIILGIGFLFISLLSLLLTRSIEEKDIVILKAVGRKIGLNSTKVEKFFQKFCG